MKYAPFIQPKDTIALVAPSYGSPIDPYKIRLTEGIKNFKKRGYHIHKGKNIFKLSKEQSNIPQKRASEFMKAYLSSSTNFVWSVAGGELMTLILPYIDLESLKKAPAKWFMGYSDNTILTFLLTTALDVASIYSYHIGAFCMPSWPNYLLDVYHLMEGKQFEFHSYEKYELESSKDENPLCALNMTEPIYWKNLTSKNAICFEGRCIGGCVDVLVGFAGTKHDYTPSFIKKYANDGFIWYFDICELTPVALSRALFQLNACGWFKNVKGFIVSRIPTNHYQGDLTYEEVLLEHLDQYNVPIITNGDIGHVPPTIPMINGAMMNLSWKQGKAIIKFDLK